MLYRWKPFFSGVKTAVSVPFGACQSVTERVTVTPFSVKLVAGGGAAAAAAVPLTSLPSLASSADWSPQAVSAARERRATTVGAVRVCLMRGKTFICVSVPLVSGDREVRKSERSRPVTRRW